MRLVGAFYESEHNFLSNPLEYFEISLEDLRCRSGFGFYLEWDSIVLCCSHARCAVRYENVSRSPPDNSLLFFSKYNIHVIDPQ